MNGDSSKMCRLCLVEAEVMCPIFNSYSKSNPQSVALPQRIMSFAQIKVAENDGLPSSICYQCLAQVDKSYQFKLQCEQSDATLRQNLQEQFEECDGEPGDWEMMKFTPEVIINEGEDNSDEMNESQEDSQANESDSDNSSQTKNTGSSYPLSEVQELLRHHGTEIRLQAVNGTGNGTSNSKLAPEQNGSSPDHTTHNGNGQHLPNYYCPLYGVEAVLNNHTAGAGPSFSPNGMAKSRRSRDGQKLFQCRLCPKSYSFSSALSRHKAVHNTELRPHVCNMCKKGFADPEKLERHMRTHVSDQLFPCDICGRVFKALATFERHKIMTQGKCRLFSCMMCGLGFPNKTKLKLHPCKAAPMERLYPCPQCNQVLNSMEAFELHVASHSGLSERPLNSQAISLITTADINRRSI
ncbi:zinc finger protein 723-like isoform X2 [Homalodisca vitripennis]|uniref:zinc finger protein 723-like isoform X2 n=1 Tax=Homalodisca vitripennis TaxID=197043 RepID=UPI001EEA647C|nr:zinc finger protein 723-like isoform X2 [Homalodisca vitripennis]